MSTQRCTFTPEFKREAASLMLDQGYSTLMEPSRFGWWSQPCVGVNQLQQERGGATSTSKAADT